MGAGIRCTNGALIWMLNSSNVANGNTPFFSHSVWAKNSNPLLVGQTSCWGLNKLSAQNQIIGGTGWVDFVEAGSPNFVTRFAYQTLNNGFNEYGQFIISDTDWHCLISMATAIPANNAVLTNTCYWFTDGKCYNVAQNPEGSGPRNIDSTNDVHVGGTQYAIDSSGVPATYDEPLISTNHFFTMQDIHALVLYPRASKAMGNTYAY